ncbi:MAG: oligosaccharide flippase family protein [Candidatus Ratteibacteria bacterium]
MSKKIPEKIVRNTLFNGIGYLWSMLIALLLTPYIIQRIGIARYGIWATLSVLTGYFGLLDFGFGQSFERYIAEYYAKKDSTRINQTISVGITLYMLLGVLFLLAGIFFTNPLLSLFRIPLSLYEEASFLFQWGLIIFAFTNIFGVFSGVLRGFQRMDLTNSILIFSTTLNAIGVLFFLRSGFGLKGLVVNQLLTSSASGFLFLASSFHIFPSLLLRPFCFTKNLFKKIASFSIKRWVTMIEYIILFPTDKIIISHFLGIHIVGFYQIGYLLADRALSFIQLINSALIPASAELHAYKAHNRLQQLYFRSTKYLICLGIPLFLFLFSMADPLLMLWMKKPLPLAANVLKIFSLSFIAVIPALSAATIAIGMEHPEIQMIGNTWQAGIKLLFTLILVTKIGYWGVILPTLFSSIIAVFYISSRFHRVLSISFRTFAQQTYILQISLLSLLITFLFFSIHRIFFTPYYHLLPRSLQAGILGMETLVFMALHAFIFIRNFFSVSDREMITQLFRFPLRILHNRRKSTL